MSSTPQTPKHATSFARAVLKGDRPEFGYIDTPDILTEAELVAQPNRTIPIFGEDGGGEPTR